MGIAWSGGHKFATIDSSSASSLIAGIYDLLTDRGWFNTPIAGGYIFSAESPQGLFFKLKVWDNGVTDVGVGCISLQCISLDDSKHGLEHLLNYGVGVKIHYALAHKCQFFIAVPDFQEHILFDPFRLPFFSHWISFACGIPHIPAPLSAECAPDGFSGEVVSLVWWASSSGGNEFGATANFRNELVCGPMWDVAWNDTQMFPQLGDSPTRSQDGRNGGEGLRLLWLSDSGGSNPFAEIKIKLYKRGPLYLDAIVAWQAQMRGQMWDAFIITDAFERDTIQRFIEGYKEDMVTPIYSYWWVWSSDFFGSLLLLKGDLVAGAGAGNYAY